MLRLLRTSLGLKNERPLVFASLQVIVAPHERDLLSEGPWGVH